MHHVPVPEARVPRVCVCVCVFRIFLTKNSSFFSFFNIVVVVVPFIPKNNKQLINALFRNVTFVATHRELMWAHRGPVVTISKKKKQTYLGVFWCSFKLIVEIMCKSIRSRYAVKCRTGFPPSNNQQQSGSMKSG